MVIISELVQFVGVAAILEEDCFVLYSKYLNVLFNGNQKQIVSQGKEFSFHEIV